jgi:hypothetical protein
LSHAGLEGGFTWVLAADAIMPPGVAGGADAAWALLDKAIQVVAGDRCGDDLQHPGDLEERIIRWLVPRRGKEPAQQRRRGATKVEHVFEDVVVAAFEDAEAAHVDHQRVRREDPERTRVSKTSRSPAKHQQRPEGDGAREPADDSGVASPRGFVDVGPVVVVHGREQRDRQAAEHDPIRGTYQAVASGTPHAHPPAGGPGPICATHAAQANQPSLRCSWKGSATASTALTLSQASAGPASARPSTRLGTTRRRVGTSSPEKAW